MFVFVFFSVQGCFNDPIVSPSFVNSTHEKISFIGDEGKRKKLRVYTSSICVGGHIY